MKKILALILFGLMFYQSGYSQKNIRNFPVKPAVDMDSIPIIYNGAEWIIQPGTFPFVKGIRAGANIAIDSTDKRYPIISATGGGENYIPLTGTEEDKSVTGTVEFKGDYGHTYLELTDSTNEEISLKIYGDYNNISNQFGIAIEMLNDGSNAKYSSASIDFSQFWGVTSLGPRHGAGHWLEINGDNNFRGLRGERYFGDPGDGRYYVQKKYVDDLIIGKYVPMAGTTEEDPVTGPVIIKSKYDPDTDEPGEGIVITNTDVGLDDGGVSIQLDNDGGAIITLSPKDENEEHYVTRFSPNQLLFGKSTLGFDNPSFINLLQADRERFLIASGLEDADFKGIEGGDYYGLNYNDKTYVQKKYVDDLVVGNFVPMSGSTETDPITGNIILGDENTYYNEIKLNGIAGTGAYLRQVEGLGHLALVNAVTGDMLDATPGGLQLYDAYSNKTFLNLYNDGGGYGAFELFSPDDTRMYMFNGSFEVYGFEGAGGYNFNVLNPAENDENASAYFYTPSKFMFAKDIMFPNTDGQVWSISALDPDEYTVGLAIGNKFSEYGSELTSTSIFYDGHLKSTVGLRGDYFQFDYRNPDDENDFGGFYYAGNKLFGAHINDAVSPHDYVQGAHLNSYVPIEGTVTGKPITGEIEMAEGASLYIKNGTDRLGLSFEEEGIIRLKYKDESDVDTELTLSDGEIEISTPGGGYLGVNSYGVYTAENLMSGSFFTRAPQRIRVNNNPYYGTAVKSLVFIDPTISYSNGSVNLVVQEPHDVWAPGLELEVVFGGTITSGLIYTDFTFTINTSDIIIGAPIPGNIVAGDSFKFIASETTGTWYRVR